MYRDRPTPTDDRRDLVTVIAHMRARPGKEQELYDALEALVEPTTRERGFVNGGLGRHLTPPHLEQFAARLHDLLEGGLGGLTITRLRRAA